MSEYTKVRTIITQDAEVDDQNSLRHFLLYSNEVDLLGIVQTSSKFHWQGIPGAVKPEKKFSDDFDNQFMAETGPFDQPYRWPGTDWMWKQIDDYEKDYPNLVKHAEGYPTPDYLRSITKIGNIGYEGEREAPSEGSELIRKCILDDDPRPLYIQVWGGCNTIARALMDIQNEYSDSETWEDLHRKISDKVILTACGEQDPAYHEYIAEEWPDIQFVKMLQLFSYAYPWLAMPESESKDTLRASFMKSEILNGKSALADGYCTWLDGKRYEGEADSDQFGANPNITKEWFGVTMMGLPEPEQYSFLSEGDSPTFFPLFDWGMRTLEDFRYGGFSGRYVKLDSEFNSRGEKLNYWDTVKDSFEDRDGNVTEVESMWPYVADIQRDFAARVEWASADTYDKGEHKPALSIVGGVDKTASPGDTVMLHAESSSPDGSNVRISWRIYPEITTCDARLVYGSEYEIEGEPDTEEHGAAGVVISSDAKPGDKIHVIVKAQADGHHRLTYYQHVIIIVE